MAWSFSTDRPIFQQIADIIVLKIISGEYPPGYRLNAVRDLALEAGVNPNTMQRALTTAEDGGIIYVRRGEGRYVTEDTEKIAAFRTEYVLKQTREFASLMKSLGLECKGLSKIYKNAIALSSVNLQVAKGRIVGLLGPNGSGKTTLIKIANGLLTPTRGEMLIDGKPIGVETKKLVSYLPDRNFLAQWMTVDGMINYFADFYSDFRRERADAMLESLGIDRKRKIKTLSKGTQEKVALILVMSREAELYMLDEPIAGVDPATRDYILRTIISNYNENATIIISTHLIADVEQILSDVIFINRGDIVLCDTVDNIRMREGKSVDELFREVFRC